MLSSVVYNEAYAQAAYQPLNGDSSYQITGTDTHSDTFGFDSGGLINLNSTAVAVGVKYAYYQINVFNPLGEYAAGGEGITGPKGGIDVEFYAYVTGIYKMTVSIALNSVPVNYTINLSGITPPSISVSQATASYANTFLISPGSATTSPAMPSAISAQLTGIVPDPLMPSLELDWSTSVVYVPSDFPIVYNSKGQEIRGQGNFEQTSYDTQEETNTQIFVPNFLSNGKLLVSGGRLILTASFVSNGVQYDTTYGNTNPIDRNQTFILGSNPTKSNVMNFIQSIPVPKNYPSSSDYDFHKIVDGIIGAESSGGIQFYGDNAPLWSSDNKYGAGIMQVTPATTNDVWNWQTNIKDGINIFSGFLSSATYYSTYYTNYFDTYFNYEVAQTEAAFGLTSLVVRLNPDQIVMQALQFYNAGYKSKNAYAFNPEEAGGGLFLVEMTGPTTATLVWQYNGGNGYVNTVLKDAGY